MTAHSENDPLVGLWQQFPTPMASRFLAQMGWDFVVLDMQHGCLNFETAYECIHTLRACGCRPWVRTSIGNYSEINKVLDLGVLSDCSGQEIGPLAERPRSAHHGPRKCGGRSGSAHGHRQLACVINDPRPGSSVSGAGLRSRTGPAGRKLQSTVLSPGRAHIRRRFDFH